jgi:mono/diheme cytochrome c family protein
MTVARTNGMTAALALVLFVGCGSKSGDTANGEMADHGDPKNFQIFPPSIYSGYDGVNTYAIPFQIFKNEGPVTITIDDMSLVSLVKKTSDTQYTYKAEKAGTTKIHAMAGGKTVSADLTITQYTPEANAAGKKRYTMGPDKDNPACMECHGAGKGPDHTPSEIDADVDDDVVNTYLTGKDPEGRPVGEEFSHLLKGYKHMWKVTEEEKKGLVVYLRSLPPTGYPEYDAPTAHEE